MSYEKPVSWLMALENDKGNLRLYGKILKGLVMIPTFKRMFRFLQNILAALFDTEQEKKYRWLTVGFLAGLFLLGVALWGKFFNWGRIPFDWHDWAEVNAARMAFLRDAIQKGVLPLHMPDASALRNVTDRFMAIPDVILSPQILLMKVLDVGQFVLANTILLYAVGMLGLLWFKRKYSISLAAFTILFLLFNFNGHILAHNSVGHITWGGYFLFPWLLALTLQLLEGDHSWRWVTLTALLLFAMWLQGSFHQFIWSLLFLAILALTSWEHILPIFKVGVAAVLLSMVRILAPALEANAFDQDFLGGYPTVWDVFTNMLKIRAPADAMSTRSALTTLGSWEFDLYVGVFGVIFIIIFGVFMYVKHRVGHKGFTQLLLPLAVMFALSIGQVYDLVRILHIPLFAGERVSARIISLPFVFIVVIGAVEFQDWLRSIKTSPVIQVFTLVGIGLIGHDLWQYLKLWQVTNAYTAFPVTPVNLAIKIVSNHPDAPYTTALAAGAAVSTLTLLFLLMMTWREKRELQHRAKG